MFAFSELFFTIGFLHYIIMSSCIKNATLSLIQAVVQLIPINPVILNFVILNFVMLNVIMLNLIMLDVILLIVIMLIVIMLNYAGCHYS
jgi:hypothetical protein